ncbi:MAG TPA: hypothetical protein VHO94_02870 [Oscillospiraceae bacterium]|nr:hypothetical protein [Oscillospiraceae bacterium]
MREIDQEPGVQEPQYAAPQQNVQQPTYVQQPQYTAPQQNVQQPTYAQQPQYTAPQQPNVAYPQAAPTDNAKVHSILSYITILWLIGLLGSEKNNPHVRFHVNQGIILTIFEFAVGIVGAILNAIISSIFTESVYGIALYTSPTGIHLQQLVSLIVWAVGIAGTIIGIVNASQGKEQPLPVIGKLFKIIK